MSAELLDEQRRAWIAAHAGIFLFQKRRADLLGKRIRARSRDRIGLRPDPHDDEVTTPLALRSASTPTGALESAVVAAVALAAPLGWPLGRLLYGATTTLIPDRLRAYPIPALVWMAVGCGLPLPVLVNPRPTMWLGLAMPWMLAQIPAVFLTAGVYGVLEGWLAIDGSTDWWPMTPLQPDVDDDLILGPGEVAMATAGEPLQKAPGGLRHARVRWVPVLSGSAVAAAGMVWYFVAVMSALAATPIDAAGAAASALPSAAGV